MARNAQAKFIPPMLLLKADRLPDDPGWTYELKLDGYRAVAFKTAGKVQLRSRNDKDFAVRYPAVVKALANLPNQTVIDGEVVAFDENGRPSFHTLQNFGTSPGPVVYYVFDVMILAGTDLTNRSLDERRRLLEQKALPELTEPIRYAAPLAATLPVLIESVKSHGLEGFVAKRRDGRYEPGLRFGRLDEDACRSWPGTRDWRPHTRGCSDRNSKYSSPFASSRLSTLPPGRCALTTSAKTARLAAASMAPRSRTGRGHVDRGI
jgi:hypothetical protein